MTGGVGLGLSVVQAIVQGHGGEIVLNHRPGGGLIATIRLPITDSAPDIHAD
jgi:signal transduction histidine kinase